MLVTLNKEMLAGLTIFVKSCFRDVLQGHAKPAFTCSKLSVETLEQGVSVLVFLFLTLNM